MRPLAARVTSAAEALVIGATGRCSQCLRGQAELAAALQLMATPEGTVRTAEGASPQEAASRGRLMTARSKPCLVTASRPATSAVRPEFTVQWSFRCKNVIAAATLPCARGLNSRKAKTAAIPVFA